jgi:hypothetical protein
MSKTRNTTSWTRRLATAAMLTAAPALIALGTAAAGHADVSTDNPSVAIHAPAQHTPFPQQTNTPQPGPSVHHPHPNRHG